MLWRFAANALVLLHLGFIVFVLLGALLVLRYRWVAWVHVPAFAWGAAIEFLGAVCPLTPLEQHLRTLAGDQGYAGGFVEHYVMPVMYPAGLTVATQFWLGIAVVVINAALYAFVLRQAWRDRFTI